MVKSARRKLSWWEWILVVIWLSSLIFFLQYAISSRAEYESRAAVISWTIFFILIAIGIIILLFRKKQASR